MMRLYRLHAFDDAHIDHMPVVASTFKGGGVSVLTHFMKSSVELNAYFLSK
jgi:hypothetical protein